MRAAVYHGTGDVRLEDVPDPVPAAGELLVRVATAGICGTDVKDYLHDPVFFPVTRPHPHSGHVGPTIPGHEFSGRVEAVGNGVGGFAPGDLVASGAGVWCGACGPCSRGDTNMCERYWTVGLHADGGLAELVAVPAMCCLNLRGSGLTPDLAALCQPMAIAVHAVGRGRTGPDDDVLVLGTGGIGSFIVHAAAAAGARVVAADLDPDRLAVAETLGAAETLVVSDDLDRRLAERTAPTVVFECTARPESLRRAVSAVSPNGRVVVVGHQPDPVAIDFTLVSMGERELVGTMAQAFDPDFAAAAELIGRNPEAWRAVAPTVYPLGEVIDAGLEAMARGQAPQIKMLFDPAAGARRPLDTGTGG